MTDNMSCWSLRQVCTDRGIQQLFIKPHCPWQNGKVERLNRTLLWWAYRQVAAATRTCSQMRVHGFIAELLRTCRSRCCRVMKVSTSGFYEWRQRQAVSDRDLEDPT